MSAKWQRDSRDDSGGRKLQREGKYTTCGKVKAEQGWSKRSGLYFPSALLFRELFIYGLRTNSSFTPSMSTVPNFIWYNCISILGPERETRREKRDEERESERVNIRPCPSSSRLVLYPDCVSFSQPIIPLPQTLLLLSLSLPLSYQFRPVPLCSLASILLLSPLNPSSSPLFSVRMEERGAKRERRDEVSAQIAQHHW